MKNKEEEGPKYETLDDLIALLLEVRVDLTNLCKSVNSEDIKEECNHRNPFRLPYRYCISMLNLI